MWPLEGRGRNEQGGMSEGWKEEGTRGVEEGARGEVRVWRRELGVR